ncbi:SIMPL domain-containing protein, partial [Symbiobacterium terraclitae]|uniref:SIMPL domain-containing protein n=1 Tax=Symbiobacterium terraclitae TaxID=557451 RepID=UPI0035B54A83
MSTLAGYGAGFAPPAAAEPPSLQVTGTGEVPVAPDTARISLGFSARAPQAAAAYEQAAAALNQVVRALVQAGVPTEMMQTQEVALNPVYRPPEDGGA